MMTNNQYSSFEEFSKKAQSDLKPSQKIGFDEDTRSAEIDKILLDDMFNKLNYFFKNNIGDSNILDIGCGCSYFTNFLIDHTISNNNNLFLIDSLEMLSNIRVSSSKVTKITGKFPMSSPILDKLLGKVDLILINSVIQHLILEDNLFTFLDGALKYLSNFGIIYIGDLPNASKQNRQLDNYAQHNYSRHQTIGENRLNDSMIMSIVSYFRGIGFNAYILPKPYSYKFSKSREDLIITKI